ncbi:hypothetical protein [Ferrimonas senticii]|uniref:hypothetical protein n=1 Tax=Ferrimonas senticii TaxID=394566 RepID=UPI00042281DF|nr:hypothetical protein [Ferrimonas senticii]
MKKTVLALAVLSLAGCGGSSDESDSSVATTSLSIKAISFDQCGQASAYPEASVLLHDSNGAILSRHSVGHSGTIELDRPSDAAHITVIGRNYFAEDGSNTDVESYLDYPLSTLTAKFEDNRNSACGCQMITVNATDLLATFSSHSLRYQTRPVNDGEQVKVCPTADGGWPTMDFLLTDNLAGPSYAVRQTINGNIDTAIYLDPDEFVAGSAITVNSEVDFDWYNSRVRLGDYWPQVANYLSVDDPSELWYFPELHQDTLISGYRLERLDSQVEYVSGIRQPIEDGAVTLPDWHGGSAFQLRVASVLESSAYDFRDVGLNKSMLSIDSYGNDVSWSINAPLNGSIPDLDLPADIQAEFGSLDDLTVTIGLWGYGSRNSYGDFLQLLQQGQIDNRHDDPRYQQYHYEQLTITP